MTRARPVLGYPSRSCACRALRSEGLDNAQIIARFRAVGEEITTQQISALLNYKLNRAARRVDVERCVIDQLTPHAARRGVTVTELAGRLLQLIADENMVDAVLDDSPPKPTQQED